MKKVLITGASGFIGSFLVEEALSKGYEVYAGMRPTSSKKFLSDSRINFLDLNLSDENKLNSQLAVFKNKNGPFDFAIHNAGITKAKKPGDFFTTNYLYTQHLVNAFKRNNLITNKFVYISSLAAFGPGIGNTPVKHSDIPNPITAYGQSKLSSEKYLFSLDDFPFVVIRPSAVYGPRDKAFLTLFQLINNKIEPYLGYDGQHLSFIYVRDLAKAVVLAMESPHQNRAWFVSDGFQYTIKNFNETIRNNLKKKTVRVVIPSALIKPVAYSVKAVASLLGKIATFSPERVRELEAANWLCDTESIKNDLNFLAEYNLQKGLKETVEWYKEQKWL